MATSISRKRQLEGAARCQALPSPPAVVTTSRRRSRDSNRSDSSYMNYGSDSPITNYRRIAPVRIIGGIAPPHPIAHVRRHGWYRRLDRRAIGRHSRRVGRGGHSDSNCERAIARLRTWIFMVAPVRVKNDYPPPTRMTVQRRRGKSPLAMESIDERYCRAAA